MRITLLNPKCMECHYVYIMLKFYSFSRLEFVADSVILQLGGRRMWMV